MSDAVFDGMIGWIFGITKSRLIIGIDREPRSRLGSRGASLLAHERIELQCERTFRIGRIQAVELLGNYQPKNPVSQKLQALVRAAPARACVGQRLPEEFVAVKCVAEPRLDGAEVVPSR